MTDINNVILIKCRECHIEMELALFKNPLLLYCSKFILFYLFIYQNKTRKIGRNTYNIQMTPYEFTSINCWKQNKIQLKIKKKNWLAYLTIENNHLKWFS